MTTKKFDLWQHQCSALGGLITSLPLSKSCCPACGAKFEIFEQVPGPGSTLTPFGQEQLKLDYGPLQDVLDRAWQQAACGKGAERHGQSLPFDRQPMQTISGLLNTECGMLYQAIKKIQESTRMDKGAAVRELLGAINYCAGAIIYLEADHGPDDR